MTDRWRAVCVFSVLMACSSVRRVPVPDVDLTREPIPRQARAHYLRAQLHIHRGDLDAAMSSLAIAAMFDPLTPWVPIAIGDVYLMAGDVTQARNAWEQATDLDPDCSDAWMRRARAARPEKGATTAWSSTPASVWSSPRASGSTSRPPRVPKTFYSQR